MKVTYKCDDCGEIFKINYPSQSPIMMQVFCEKCGANATRQFSITTSKEDENVSAAIQTMLYSTLPSGKNKVAI